MGSVFFQSRYPGSSQTGKLSSNQTSQFVDSILMFEATAGKSAYSYSNISVFWGDNDRKTDFMQSLSRVVTIMIHNPPRFEVKLEVWLYGWKRQTD